TDIEEARRRSEVERLSTEKEKSCVFTGSYCVNRLSGERVPIYIAEYALLTYGTGAVMGVPAHDTRDFEYAKKYGIPIKTVIAPDGWQGEELEEAYVEPGTMVNSGRFDGLSSEEGKEAIADAVERDGTGRRTVSYRFRDWLISRQRYWGAPIPMVYCSDCGVVPVPEADLPVLLPEDAEFRPTGESPLTYHEEFVNTTCPKCGSPARRETDTMDTFMCSSWYFLRYTSPKYDEGPFDPEKLRHWLPVDQYTGGAEHAVMHLLYARFFIKALRDIGLLEFDEPFLRLFNQGVIVADRQKMSKSRGNVITPDPYVETFGADVVRAYLMFVGPWDQGGEWSDTGLNGIIRWYDRLWDLVVTDEGELDRRPTDDAVVKQTLHMVHKTIKKVAGDLEQFRFNTMLATLMELTNYLAKVWEAGSVGSVTWRDAIKTLLLLLAPTAPHLTEELWSKKGYPYSIHSQSFPQWDEALAAEEEITLVIQVNGKVRDRVVVPAAVTEEEARELALGSERVKAYLDNKNVIKVVYVPGRLVNIVVE
ncbi:MAG: class I tRNA ligase family protein, partial [Dehalococcoidia bacterium]